MEIFTLSPDRLQGGLKEILENKTVPTDLVCFDFYDTLVFRTILPEETKKKAAYQLAALLEADVDGELLYRLRAVLEKRLCIGNRANGNDPEFNLVPLAGELNNVLKGLSNSCFLKDIKRFTSRFIEIELAIEKTVQHLNKEVVEALIYCRERRITTALVSDFYLPKEHFSKLLGYHDLTDLFDFIFVSADYLHTKGSSGKLYENVIRETGCDPSVMLMIGDNYHADCLMANEKGITSIYVKAPAGPVAEQKISSPALEKQANKVYETVFAENEINYFPEIGLSLYRFIHKLFEQVLQDKCKELFFCSKEGEFLKKLFISYQDIRFGHQVVASHYLLVSRKATFICSLKNLEEENFDRLFDVYRDMSLVEFLKSLNFSDERANKICKNLAINPIRRHTNIKAHADFRKLIESDRFRRVYDSHRHCQKENFLSYLKTFNVNFDKNGLSIVDVGWKGSIQNNIFSALDGNVPVTGYYIGLLSPTELSANNRKNGLLFSNYPENTRYIHVYNNNRSLFEMVLGASHGSADGYFTRTQFAEEKRGEFSELTKNDNGGAEPYATVLDLPDERVLFNEFINPIQEGILKLCTNLTKIFTLSDSQLPSAEWFARMHARTVFNPTEKEIELYSRLYHLENFGIFEFTNFEREKVPLLQKIKNFLALRKDPAAFVETGVWPPIIYRRLGLDYLAIIDGKRRYKRIFGKNK